MIHAKPHIATMDAYALADMTVGPGKPLVSLAQNESAFAPSPKAIEGARASLQDCPLYPDPDWTDLRAAISATHGVDPEKILCGAGSMELIAALIRTYAGPGDEVLASEYSYAFFRTATLGGGAIYRAAPECDLMVDVDNLLAAVTARTRIVCVANPGNPTGTWLPRAELARLRDALPPDVLLLIDEAYAEFAPADPVWDLTARGDTVVLRTLSKAYGLAGARVGWGLFPPGIASEVRKLLNPNNISGTSQVIATGALMDQAYMQETVRKTAALREQFRDDLRAIGRAVPPSHTNFVLIPFPDAATAGSADAALRAEGVLLRGMGGYGLPHCLRATIGAAESMRLAADVLGQWTESHL